jgi:hypothetical protein
MTAMNHTEAGLSLDSVIERSAELKRDLIDFAYSPRMERHLDRFMLESAGHEEELDEGEAAGIIDRFVLQHRLPNGKAVLDLEYRTYSNLGPGAFRQVPKGGFLHARLVPVSPVPGAWLVSGYMSVFPKSSAAEVGQVALQFSAEQPELVFRNPAKIERGWQQMRKDRAAFIGFFGCDELALPPAEVRERLSAYYRHCQEAALAANPRRRKPQNVPGEAMLAFGFPDDLANASTVGLVYDEIDGLNFYIDYGMLRELFADPALAADKRYTELLRGYLASDSIGPLPFRRLAAGHPETVDAVFRKVLRKSTFTWAEHGEALLRRRKPWYYEQERRPSVTVISARIEELVGLR